MTSTISMTEVKGLLNYTIDNNIRLQEEEGKMPVSICLEAEAGIGKTSIVEQVAKERNMTYTKLGLHELDEVGDLLGWPQLEYECQVAKRIKDAEGNIKLQILPGTTWLNAKQLESMDKNTAIKQTGKTRMSYAKPAWVPEYNENGTVLCLDDFGRCNQALSQAIMELIRTQSYASWKLPKKTSIILTSNPDNGTYNVNTQDVAQSDRYLNFSIAFSPDAWMQWAETANVDGRCINFVASYSDELFNIDEQGNRICTPRSFVMFSDMISGIKDWDNSENLSFIQTIAKGCFKDEGSKFSTMFGTFIRNKMHQLIQPKDMLLGDWDKTREKLEETLYDKDGSYRPDIASLLERRFSNYVGAWLKSSDKTPFDKVKKRIVDFIDADASGKRLFNRDLLYHMVKTIIADNKRQTSALVYEPKVAALLR